MAKRSKNSKTSTKERRAAKARDHHDEKGSRSKPEKGKAAIKTGWQAATRRPKGSEVLPNDLMAYIDPLGISGETRAITLNLPVHLWNRVDEIIPSRGKNRFFIALLLKFLEESEAKKPKKRKR